MLLALVRPPAEAFVGHADKLADGAVVGVGRGSVIHGHLANEVREARILGLAHAGDHQVERRPRLEGGDVGRLGAMEHHQLIAVEIRKL